MCSSNNCPELPLSWNSRNKTDQRQTGARGRSAELKLLEQNASTQFIKADQEIQEIMAFMEHALEEVKEQITQDMSAYDKVKTVYTYLIDHAEYEASEDDQNIAGISGKRKLCVPDMRGRYSIFGTAWSSVYLCRGKYEGQ